MRARLHFLILFLLLISLSAAPVRAQFGIKLPGGLKIPPIPGLPGGDKLPLPGLPDPSQLLDNTLLGHDAITTGIKDSNREVPYLDDFSPLVVNPLAILSKDKNGDFLVTPGDYSGALQSYCLHAGTHGPTQGAGYVLTTLKGPKAYIINKILAGSSAHPDVPQFKIQSLIWAIEAHANYKTMSPDMRQTAVTLLSPKDGLPSAQDILELAGGAVAFLPQNKLDTLLQKVSDAARPIYQAQNQIRQASTLANSFPQMEAAAVLGGSPPPDENDRPIPHGRWSYTDNGLFIRYSPSGYSRTQVEVYCPEQFFIRYDKAGFVRQIESSDHNYKLEATYGDGTALSDQDSQRSLSAIKFSSGKQVICTASLNAIVSTSPPDDADANALHYQQLLDIHRRFIGDKPRALTVPIISLTNFKDSVSGATASQSDLAGRQALIDFIARAWMATAYQWINEDKKPLHAALVYPDDVPAAFGKPKVRLAQVQLVIPLIEVLVGTIELTAEERAAISALRLAMQNMVACPGNTYAQRLEVSNRSSDGPISVPVVKVGNPAKTIPDDPESKINTVRVQLQGSRSGQTPYTDAIVVNGPADTGVTIAQVNAAIRFLFYNHKVGYTGGDTDFIKGMAYMSKRLTRYPPSGTSTIGNIERYDWSGGKLSWRLDVENLRGTNLKE